MRLHPNRGAFARPPRAFRGVRSRDAESAGLGDVFLDAVEHGVAVLKAQPGLGTPIRREMRWFVIARFPFSIVYRVDRGTRGGEARLYILAIAHQRRRPLYWAGRS